VSVLYSREVCRSHKHILVVSECEILLSQAYSRLRAVRVLSCNTTRKTNQQEIYIVHGFRLETPISSRKITSHGKTDKVDED
jgi:hypothetical protein